MSSLAAARADNFWIPNDPEQQTAYAGKAPGNLGARAKKQDQGILVIRFEMPYNVNCAGCGHMIAKGVRFNAEKKQVGKYFSTKIWSFTMKAPCCKEVIEVHTDPKAAEYILVRGARKKVEEFTAEAIETIELRSKEEVEAARANPFARLETGLADAQRAKAAAPTVVDLQRLQTERSKNDYELNKMLRKGLRAQRHAAQALEQQHRALNLPEHIPLLPGAAEDAAAAAAVRFGAPGGGFERSQEQLRDRRREILSAPLLRAADDGTAGISGRAGGGGVGGGGGGGAGGGVSAAFSGHKGSAAARQLDEAADRRAELLAKRRRLEQNGVSFGGGGSASRAAAAGASPFGGAFGGGSSFGGGGGGGGARVVVKPKQQQQPGAWGGAGGR